jgi:hypothetical protein
MNRIHEDTAFNLYGVDVLSYRPDHAAIEAALDAANIDYIHEEGDSQYWIENGRAYAAITVINSLGYQTDEDN